MMPEPLITEQEVAEYLGLAVITIRKWRQRGRGPKWVKCGTAVRYDWADVHEWVRNGGDPKAGERS
jgi:excisionase family DNA binding protein